jgi:hypothetical protein
MRKISISLTLLLLLLAFLVPPAGLAAPLATPHLQDTPQPDDPALLLGQLARAVVERLTEVRLLPDLGSKGPTPVARGTGQTLPPERWQEWPVLPVVSQRARQIYELGLEMGNIPTHFSKVGDCQNIRQYFLGMFDTPGTYGLGRDNEYLIRTISYFSGSWGRLSEAVRSGFNVASVLTPLNANPKTCLPGETPLECEFRAWKPAFVLISMETWTKDRPTDAYEGYLRQIIEFAIAKGAVPILATKADNLEGDHSINLTVARLADEYDIPLWNFWRAADPLPYHGLTEDGFHLTNAPNFFNDAGDMEKAWPVRNLTSLQAIDAVWKAVTK